VAAPKGHRRPLPHRTCVACRTVRPKRQLVRIVRTPEGEVVVDEKGKRNGRGAYLCARRGCWIEALTRRRLDPALRLTLDSETINRLLAYAETLPEALPEESGA
jgi:predicted RNA-binding protein YlxR (DUF448 family)